MSPSRRDRPPGSTSSVVERSAASLLRDAEKGIGRSPKIEHWQPELARYDAEVLLGHVLGEEMVDVDPGKRRLTEEQARRFRKLVKRRIAGEPNNYITGHFNFCDLDVLVRRGVFSPRASSEFMVEVMTAALRRRRGATLHVDVATGSGAIALAMAARVKKIEVWGLDIAKDAVKLGRKNAEHNDLDNVRFKVSDMLAALPERLRGQVDSFSIHPPYVARDEVALLPAEIREWEPQHTLTDGSDDGLGLVRRLAEEAPGWLRPRGWVFVEIGPYLSKRTQGILRRAGFTGITSKRDEVGATRVVSARLG